MIYIGVSPFFKRSQREFGNDRAVTKVSVRQFGRAVW
jgi:hypothetical protein